MSIILTTGQIIACGDGRLACDMGQVYEALNAITGDNLFTHQLPRAFDFASPYIREACPWVADLPPMPNVDGLDRSEVESRIYGWVEQISAEHGTKHEAPDLSNQWVHFNPLEEAAAIFGVKQDRHVDQ